MKDVIIIGAGGHARVIADIVRCRGDRCLGFLDDFAQDGVGDIPVLGTIKDYVNYPNASFIVGIGNAAVRRKVVRSMEGVRWYTAIHPAAVVSELNVSIGPGTAVMAGAIINTGAVIGAHAIINTAAVVEHDNRIGDFVHISVGAKLAGTVTVGPDSWVGIGAVVSNNLSICGGCMIGAGAVVIRSIGEPGTYVGVPAGRTV